MAMPKKRMSPVRSGNRRRQLGLTLPASERCSNCAALHIKHVACGTCGQYKGRQAMTV